MSDRPYTLLSCCVSLDGYLDDASPQRLVLSPAADLERVDAERARCDAILVGAETVRRDDPRLLVRSEGCRAARVARGLSPTPLRVTVTASGDLDPGARIFTEPGSGTVVFARGAGGATSRAATGRDGNRRGRRTHRRPGLGARRPARPRRPEAHGRGRPSGTDPAAVPAAWPTSSSSSSPRCSWATRGRRVSSTTGRSRSRRRTEPGWPRSARWATPPCCATP